MIKYDTLMSLKKNDAIGSFYVLAHVYTSQLLGYITISKQFRCLFLENNKC